MCSNGTCHSSTDPIGATVYVDGDEFETTPTEMNLSLDKDHIITIILDGYKQETIEVKRKFKNNDMVASHCKYLQLTLQKCHSIKTP